MKTIEEFNIKIDFLIDTWKDTELTDELIGLKNIIEGIIFEQKKEFKKMVEEMKKDEMPVGLGHTLYGYNEALIDVLDKIT